MVPEEPELRAAEPVMDVTLSSRYGSGALPRPPMAPIMVMMEQGLARSSCCPTPDQPTSLSVLLAA